MMWHILQNLAPESAMMPFYNAACRNGGLSLLKIAILVNSSFSTPKKLTGSFLSAYRM